MTCSGPRDDNSTRSTKGHLRSQSRRSGLAGGSGPGQANEGFREALAGLTYDKTRSIKRVRGEGSSLSQAAGKGADAAKMASLGPEAGSGVRVVCRFSFNRLLSRGHRDI